MKKLLLILLFTPLIGIGQKILSKTTIFNGKIVEYSEYYKDGKIKSIMSYDFNERWEEDDTTIVYYNEDGDTSGINYGFISSCSLEKTYNSNQKVVLIYWSCSDGLPGDREIWSEGIKEFEYNERDILIEKRECLGEGSFYSTDCYDDMKITYYNYNKDNYLIEKIVSIRENRNQDRYDTVFNKIETIEQRIRYDYDMYGNNIRITNFNSRAEIISTDIMIYENNLLHKKELISEDTMVIDYQYNQDDTLIGVEEHLIGNYNYYERSEEFNHIGQLIFTSEYSRGPDYQCYYQYNDDGNLINSNCYEISGEYLNNCNVSVYSYNSYGDLIAIIDYNLDEDDLDEIGGVSYDIIDKINNSTVNIKKLSKEKSVTNIKYEYY